MKCIGDDTGNVLITGIAGCGKTEYAKKVYTYMRKKRKSVLCLTFQNKAKVVLKNRINDDVRAYTFDSYFFQNRDINAYNCIIIDEVFNVPIKWIRKLVETCNCRVIAFGDQRQCLPVDPIRYNYKLCNAFNSFFPLHVELQYKEGCSRYDKPLRDAIAEFLRTRRLPKVFF